MYTSRHAADSERTNIADHKKNREIFQQQRDILLDAISTYLTWRSGKSKHDDRGYPVTMLTYLRHMTRFGETRANTLRRILSSALSTNPISVLSQHFSANSTVDNHSLDTYLLEAIFENKKLFLVVDGPFFLHSKHSRELLRNIIVKQANYNNAEYACLIGNLYAEDSKVEGHIELACFYYAIGARQGNKNAVDALTLLARARNNEARYLLAFDYFHPRNQFSEAIGLCLMAAEQGHEQAIAYLHNTAFNVDLYLSIAERYESKRSVLFNITSALVFYEKAYALNSGKAALRLGQLYQPEPDCSADTSSAISIKNWRTAFNYYHTAAKQGSEVAMREMIEIAEAVNDDYLYFIVGKLHLDVFQDSQRGLSYFKKLADKNVEEAMKKLEELTTSNAEYAYIAGTLYEKDIKNENYLQKALKYYGISLSRGHQGAKKVIEDLAATNNSDAQYMLGVEYYHRQGHLKAAIRWCLLAAGQGHSLAITYLHKTDFSVDLCLGIAKYYEHVLVPGDMAMALIFYEKAFALNDRNAALHLGELYQPTLGNMPELGAYVVKDARKAFHYYLVAARQGCKTAMTQMVKLTKDLDDNNLRVTLAMLALSVFGKSEQALGWIKRLSDAHVPAAVSALGEITEKNDEHAYMVGKLYEDDSNAENHMSQALHYYTMSLANDNRKALAAIKQMASKNNAEAEYILGMQWYQHRGMTSRAIYWCVRAAAHNHQIAKDYLFNTDFEASHCITIAELFSNDREIKSNSDHALLFYQKAFNQGDISAAIRLGAWYNPHINPGMKNDEFYQENVEKSFEYYELAVKKGEREALNALENLLNNYENETLQFRLAQIYLDSFNDIGNAMLRFKKSIEAGCVPAANQVQSIVTTNANGAYILAKLYEQDMSLQKAAYYHMLAIQNNHDLSRESFNELVNMESMSANDLYAIANMCFHGLEYANSNVLMAKLCFEILIRRRNNGESTELFGEIYYNLGIIYQFGGVSVTADAIMALKCFQLAEGEGHYGAIEKLDAIIDANHLTASQLITIATLYLNIPDQKCLNWHRILTCYEQASSLRDLSATRWLAEFYQIDHDDIPTDSTKAFNYYLRLAEFGDADAFPPLERLAEEVGKKEQCELSRVYASFFNNHERAGYWRKQVDETKKLAADFSRF